MRVVLEHRVPTLFSSMLIHADEKRAAAPPIHNPPTNCASVSFQSRFASGPGRRLDSMRPSASSSEVTVLMQLVEHHGSQDEPHTQERPLEPRRPVRSRVLSQVPGNHTESGHSSRMPKPPAHTRIGLRATWRLRRAAAAHAAHRSVIGPSLSRAPLAGSYGRRPLPTRGGQRPYCLASPPRQPTDAAAARSRAMSVIMSSWPPTILRRPTSTRIARVSRPWRRAAVSAWRRKLE